MAGKFLSSRPWTRRILLATGIFVGVTGALVVALRIAAATSLGRNFVEARVEGINASGISVEIDGMEGDLLGTLRIARLTLRDSEGVFATADDLLLDWAPMSLLSKTLRVKTLEGGDIVLLRQPVTEPSPSPSNGGGGSPLDRYVLDNLAIERIEIAEPVAGQAATFTLTASADAGGESGKAKIRLTPVSGTEDRLVSDLAWSVDEGLSGDLDASLAAGGALATALGLPEDKDLRAGLSARGDLDSWQLEASAALGGVDVLVLDASRRSGDLGATGQVNLAALSWVNENLDRFGDRLDIKAGTGDGRVTFAAEARDVRLEAGTVWPLADNVLEASGIDFNLALAPDADLLPPETGDVGAAEISGNLRQDGRIWNFEGSADIAEISVSGYGAGRVSGPVIVSYGPEALDFDTSLSVQALAGLPDAAITLIGSDTQVSARGAYTLDSGNLFLNRAELASDGTRATAEGSATFGEEMSLDLSGEIETQRLADLSGARAEGARLDWTLRQLNGEPQIVTAQGEVAGLANLPFPAGDWLGQAARVDLAVSLAESGPLIERFILTGDNVEAEASGNIEGDRMALTASVNAGAASDGSLSLGPLSLTATLDGNFSDFAFTTDGRLESVDAAGFNASGLVIDASGARGADAMSVDLDLSAESAVGQPLRLVSSARLAEPAWRISGLKLDWGTLGATADISGSLDDLLAIDGTANISGTPPFDGLPFEAVNADLSATNGQIDLDAALEGLSLAGFTFPDAKITANGTPDALDYRADFAGEGEIRAILREVGLTLDGRAERGADGFVTRTNLNGNVGDLDFSTTEPLLVAFADGLTAQTALSMLGGRLDLSYEAGETRRIAARSSELELAPVFELLARPDLEGRIKIETELTGPAGAPLQGSTRLELSGLDSIEVETPALSADINARFAATGLDADADITGEAGLSLTASATAPSDAATMLGFDMQGVQLSAEGGGPLATIWAYAGPPETELRGDFRITTETGAGNGLSAVLSVADATFEHGTLGLYLTNLDLDASFADSRLSLDSVSAEGREGGGVSGSGAYTLGETGRFEVTLSDLVAVRRRGLSATASGSVAYDIGTERNEIAGEIMIDDAVFSLDTALPESRPPTLDVTFRSPETGEPEADAPVDPTPTYLDITLTAPQQLSVRGRGVNAELGVNATIGGTLADPGIQGVARVVRGDVEFAGRRFDFVDSRVTIAGDPSDARLDLTAEYDTTDFTARINITGTPMRPDIAMSSSPDLPEDQVLSRVLFGRSPTELSALEAAQLASALSSLAGGGSGFSLTGSIQDALGLDRVDLGQSADGSASLSTGKYLAEDIYLELETTGSGTPGVALEWTPLENVEVGTMIDPVEGPEFSVQWKRDYD